MVVSLACLPIAGSLDLIWTYSHILGGGMIDHQRISTIFVGTSIGFAFIVIGFYMFKPEPQQLVDCESNFEVVDKYKNCEVVR
jgi:hypothetical protein